MNSVSTVRQEIEAAVQRFVTLANTGSLEAFADLYTALDAAARTGAAPLPTHAPVAAPGATRMVDEAAAKQKAAEDKLKEAQKKKPKKK